MYGAGVEATVIQRGPNRIKLEVFSALCKPRSSHYYKSDLGTPGACKSDLGTPGACPFTHDEHIFRGEKDTSSKRQTQTYEQHKTTREF